MGSRSTAGLVQTVLGTISPDRLGATSTHEHILIDFSCMFNPPAEASQLGKAYEKISIENLGWIRWDPYRNLDNCGLTDEELAIDEVLRFKRYGGGTIVDATTIGIGRDQLGLARVSRATGVNIVAGAGYYIQAVHPKEMERISEAELAEQMSKEVTTGIGETCIKAGIIGELGCSRPMGENEKRVLRAAAKAQRQCGASILVHPGRYEQAPFEIMSILADAGADTDRVVISHMDRTIFNEESLLELAQLGCYLEYDLFGDEVSYYSLAEHDKPSDAQRIALIKLLIKEGYGHKVVIAQDICTKHRLTRYGGHGYYYILENVVPRMLRKGISQEAIDTILIDNPARILTLV